MKKLMSLVLVLILALCAVSFAEEAAYTETVVTIKGEQYDIPATVCMPAGEGPFPAVVMLHGTGSNRDEAGNGYKMAAPFSLRSTALPPSASISPAAAIPLPST